MTSLPVTVLHDTDFSPLALPMRLPISFFLEYSANTFGIRAFRGLEVFSIFSSDLSLLTIGRSRSGFYHRGYLFLSSSKTSELLF